jgi:hypothetical protein
MDHLDCRRASVYGCLHGARRLAFPRHALSYCNIAPMIDYAKASICDDRWAEQALSRDRGQDNLTDSPSVLPTQAW